jgi:hypothetical protein
VSEPRYEAQRLLLRERLVRIAVDVATLTERRFRLAGPVAFERRVFVSRGPWNSRRVVLLDRRDDVRRDIGCHAGVLDRAVGDLVEPELPAETLGANPAVRLDERPVDVARRDGIVTLLLDLCTCRSRGRSAVDTHG